MSPYSMGNSHRYCTLHSKDMQHHMATIVDVACQGYPIFNMYHQWCKHLTAVLHGKNIQHCMATIFDVTWKGRTAPSGDLSHVSSVMVRVGTLRLRARAICKRYMQVYCDRENVNQLAITQQPQGLSTSGQFSRVVQDIKNIVILIL